MNARRLTPAARAADLRRGVGAYAILFWRSSGRRPCCRRALCSARPDVQSRQYTRWGVSASWWPYKVTFRHRSRWSHGIVFGTLIRVVYFAAAVSLVTALAVYLRATLVAGGAMPGWEDVLRAGRAIGAGAAAYGIGAEALLAVFAGLWWGAASHTLTDVAWSVVRKGSEIF